MATDRTVLVRLKANVSDYVAGMGAASAATRGLERDTGRLRDNINTTNDRTAWLAQGLLALAPAAVPIGAAIVPAIAGIATQLGLTAAAAGVTAIAFNGVGDGLKALNAYQLEPTAANLAKVREEYEKLGPSGVAFIEHLDSLSDELASVRSEARDEMFPGVTQSIDSLMTRLPEVRNLVGELAEGMGMLAAEAGEGVAGGGFDDFFQYLEDNAQPLLLDLGRTLGNFVTGFTDMWIAFDPLTQQFSDGFLQMSRDYADWAEGLESNDTFQDFIAYIQESIPRVQDFLGSLTDAFVALVQALAPIGGPMLTGMAKLLDLFALVVDTPVGTAFFAIAAGLSAYGRAMAIVEATTGGALGKLVKASPVIAGTTNAFRSGLPALGQWGNAMMRVGQSAEYQTAKTRGALQAVGGFGRALGPAAAAVGGLAFAMSDLDDEAGLTNTTMFALMGLMAGGGVGAAIGATVGATMDAAAANNDFADALERVQTIMSQSPGDFQAQGQALDKLRGEYQAFADEMSDPGWLPNLAYMKNQIEGVFGDSDLEEMADPLRQVEVQFQHTQWAMSRLHGAMSEKPDTYTADWEDLGRTFERVSPAMEALGITIDDINNADSSQFAAYVKAIERWNRAADSVGGRTRDVAQAVADIDDDLISTADSASALATALEALLGPGLNAEEAFDAMIVALRDLRTELKDMPDPFEGNSKAALENRALTREAAAAITEMLSTQAEAGASSEELARKLARAREQFIAEGVAAGISAKEMRERANAIGLTPKLVRTVLQAVGIDESARKLAALQEQLRKYGLTRAEAKALLEDAASGKIRGVQTLVDKYGLTKAEAKALLQDLATPRIQAILAKLDDVDDYVATSTIRTYQDTIHRVFRLPGGGRVPTEDVYDEANGGVLDFYARGGLRERHVAQIAPAGAWRVWAEPETGGEAYIPLAPQKRDRSRLIADEVVSRLGGQVTWMADGGLLEQAYRGALQAASPATVTFPGAFELSGVLDTPFGPAHVKGIARAEASKAVDDFAQAQHRRAGTRYPS